MNVDIICTGSSGNCAVIDKTIIIDAGQPTGVVPDGQYLFLTHFHSDHTKSLKSLLHTSIYCMEETERRLQMKYPLTPFNVMNPNKVTYIETENYAYKVATIKLRHDAPCVAFDIVREPLYDSDEESTRIFFGTDFNSLVDEMMFVSNLKNKRYDAIYIECNNTLNHSDFFDCYLLEDGEKEPKDAFHRRKSFQNHCNVDYLTSLFERAGYSKKNRFTEPVTFLHKSSYYYKQNPEKIADLLLLLSDAHNWKIEV